MNRIRINDKNSRCPYCNGQHIRRHGTTSRGSIRFRCLDCKKTWTNRETFRQAPENHILTSIYLQGLSYRQIRTIYQMSPMRLNKRIRAFLDGCPSWEEYLDTCVDRHAYKVIDLFGLYLQEGKSEHGGHNIFLAVAIDAMSTVVLGFEVAEKETSEVWVRFLNRLRSRNVVKPRFLIQEPDPFIADAIKKVYPESSIKDYSFFLNYDYKLLERLNIPSEAEDIRDSTIINILSPFDFFSDGYLAIFKNEDMRQVLLQERELVLQRLLVRIKRLKTTRIEGFKTAITNRFKAFRFLKEDPWPIINGWIAWYVTQNLEIGYSRLSLYMQRPALTSFMQFSCGQIPVPIQQENRDRLVRFVVEIATRRLQLPLF